jgi:hypothetical protein
MATLLLDRSTWDLALDASGNWAVATDIYAILQDCASAVRVFLGEVYYDTTQGLPYMQDIMAHQEPLALLKARICAAAMTVPGCALATCTISSVAGRKVSGQLQITTSTGAVGNVGF